MAGFQIVEPSAGSTDWTDFSVIVNDMMQGFMALSLTNFGTTGVPLIAAGGKVEVAGSLYSFASTEAITGSLSTNQNYIMNQQPQPFHLPLSKALQLYQSLLNLMP